jgi:hypothetical protein
VSAGDLRYGRRGGNWLPQLVDGEPPFGVVDGVRQTCPTPVLVRCGCSWPSWTSAGDVGKTCCLCREPTRRA